MPSSRTSLRASNGDGSRQAKTARRDPARPFRRTGHRLRTSGAPRFQQCELRVGPLNSGSPVASHRLFSGPNPRRSVAAGGLVAGWTAILVEKSHAVGTREIGIVERAGWIFRALTPIDWRGSTAFFSPDGRAFAFDVPASDAGVAARHLRDGHRWQRTHPSRRRARRMTC